MNFQNTQWDTIIIGAGIAGLAAGRTLANHDHSVLILDKSRGVGGRMATRRNGDAWFDHGAQFITAHGLEFQEELEQWKDAGKLQEWFRRGDHHPRYAGSPSMTAGPKHLAKDLEIRLSSPVKGVSFEHGIWKVEAEEFHWASQLVVAFPVPQALTLFHDSGITLAQSDLKLLSSIHYYKCLSALLILKDKSGMANPGFLRFDNPEPIESIADNQIKGVSRMPTLTVHAGPAFSETYFENREEGLRLLIEALSQHVNTEVVEASIHGWKFAKRKEESQRLYYGIQSHNLWFCGDSFGPSRIEGAFLSGKETALKVNQVLERKLSC